MRPRLLLLALASIASIAAVTSVTAAPGSSPASAPAAIAAAAPGPSALPRTVPIRSAEQLRADLHGSMALADIPDLSVDELVTMSRLFSIDDSLDNITTYYGTDYLWSLAMMMAGSGLDPTAQGPQVEDRGLGQIGVQIEQVARDWGTDPSNAYYSPSLPKDGSIWDPNVNMHAQAIWLRNILTLNYLTTIEQTDAIYARGLSAVDPATGAISVGAQTDVERARSYIPTLQKLLFLKDFVRRDGGVPTSLSPIARQILEIDRTTADGAPAYTAYRDLYAGLAMAGPPNAYLLSAYLHEAVTYTNILNRAYGVDVSASARQIRALMDGCRAAVSRQTNLVALFDRDYATLAGLAGN